MSVSYFEPDYPGIALAACRQVEKHAERGELTIEEMSDHVTRVAHIMMTRLEANESLRETFRKARETV